MSRPQVLVVDDDPLFRSLLASMLRKDFQVTVASDGAEAYYRALECPPDLAIVDIRMPGWDGLRTLKAFRAHHALCHVPIIMLTSDSSRQTVIAATKAGASEYVLKTTLCRDDFLRKVCMQLNVADSRLSVESRGCRTTVRDEGTAGEDDPSMVAVPSETNADRAVFEEVLPTFDPWV